MSTIHTCRDTPDYEQVLDRHGEPLSNADIPETDDDLFVSLYEDIVFARRFDRRLVSLQRQGRISTYAPMVGQEAAQIAAGYALGDEDWVFPTYRDHALKVVRGMDPASVVQVLRGIPAGNAIPAEKRLLPEYIPIATQIPQAVGTALSRDHRDADEVVLCSFGDGATSEGDFHEGLNFAGVFDAPVVFLCNNNGWAISTPVERQTATETFAEKAQAYGIEGVRVDGMDPLAVYRAVREAAENARDPEGPRPRLIEAVQYRLGAHSTSDDPSVYRDEDEVDRWRARDPIPRFEAFLRARGFLDDERVDAIASRADERVEDAVERAEQTEIEQRELIREVYERVPDRLEAQLAEVEDVDEV